MKKILVLSLIVTSAYGADLGPENKFLVMPMNKNVDTSSLAGDHVKILPVHKSAPYESSLPAIAERDKIFRLSGLDESVTNWDDFERDSLFIKLSKPGPEAIAKIHKKHPELSLDSLRVAQKLISER